MCKLALRLWPDESGQDFAEYALPLALISLAALASMNNHAQAAARADR